MWSLLEEADLLKKPEGNVGKTFSLVASVTEAFPKKGSDMVRKMVLDNRSIYPLDSQALKNLDAVVIFQFVLNLKVAKSDIKVPVYVDTSVDLSNPFCGWATFPDVRNVEGWQNLKQNDFNKWDKKMEAVVKAAHQKEFTVKLLLTKTGKPFVQVLETNLWN